MASVGFFRRPNTLPVHPLASPCTPGHRGIAGDGSGSPRRVRSLCGLGARRPGRAIRPREADTQTRPGRSWPRLRGVDARAPLRAHSRPRSAGRSGARPPLPNHNTGYHLWSRQQPGGDRGACGNRGGGDLAPAKMPQRPYTKMSPSKKNVPI